MDNKITLTEAIQYKNGSITLVTEYAVREAFITLEVNGKKLVTLACLDDDIYHLGIGYLLTEGLIETLDDLIEYELSGRKILFRIKDKDFSPYFDHRTKFSGCGGGYSAISQEVNKRDFPIFPLAYSDIIQIAADFSASSSLFRQTGGVHSALLINNYDKKIVAFADDIGRHNAVDKVIGGALIQRVDFKNCSLITSGRISYEIVRKISSASIPIIISRSAPTSRSIAYAYQSGIYLVGFTRGNRFNIYTGLNQIKLSSANPLSY